MLLSQSRLLLLSSHLLSPLVFLCNILTLSPHPFEPYFPVILKLFFSALEIFAILSRFSKNPMFPLLILSFDLLLFINIELPIYIENNSVRWAVILRMCSLMLEFQRRHLSLSWNIRKIVLIGLIPIIASINLGLRVGIVPKRELLPFVMEVVLLLIVILGMKKGKKKRVSENYLEFLHEGLIILSRKAGKNRKNSSFKLISCNLKSLNAFNRENPFWPSEKNHFQGPR